MLTLGLEGKKWEIFKSAVDLFSSNGYDNTSMRDIADANGLKSASLYNHFPSKESILEAMYQFYYENVENSIPQLDDVLSFRPEMSPREILLRTMTYYEADLQPYMDKIYFICILRNSQDHRANNVVWTYSFDMSAKYLRSVLKKMIEFEMIEPLDIESFIELFTSFAFTAVFKQNSDNPLGKERWLKGLDLLFSTVKEKVK